MTDEERQALKEKMRNKARQQAANEQEEKKVYDEVLAEERAKVNGKTVKRTRSQQKKKRSKVPLIIALVIVGLLVVGAFGNRKQDDGQGANIVKDENGQISVPAKEDGDSSNDNEEVVSEEESVVTDDTNNDMDENVNEEETVPSDEFDYQDMHVKFNRYEVTTNEYTNEPMLAVYLDYTNNSDEADAFMYNFKIEAYQNGISLDTTIMSGLDEATNATKKIQPGATLLISDAYDISDTSTPILIQVKPMMEIGKETVLLEKEIVVE